MLFKMGIVPATESGQLWPEQLPWHSNDFSDMMHCRNRKPASILSLGQVKKWNDSSALVALKQNYFSFLELESRNPIWRFRTFLYLLPNRVLGTI